MISLIDQILFLQKIPIFQNLTVDELGQIAAITKTDNFEEDEILFKEGDLGDQAYIVISGEIKIYKRIRKDNEITIARLRNGACFGEMALFDGEPRSASARTTAPSVLSIYSREDLMSVINQYPTIALGIINEISKRLRSVQMNLDDYKKTIDDFRILYKKMENI
ncbi:Crp/Fnr family transcriptional regulator [Thermodesulfobacteriota bacterium]